MTLDARVFFFAQKNARFHSTGKKNAIMRAANVKKYKLSARIPNGKVSKSIFFRLFEFVGINVAYS